MERQDRAAQSIRSAIDQAMWHSKDVILPEIEGEMDRQRKKTQRDNYIEGRGEGKVNDINAIDFVSSVDETHGQYQPSGLLYVQCVCVCEHT